MQINILGAGPAGLYAAILLKRMRADLTVRVFEQNPPDATFGFGVVFSDQALEFLRGDDPETADLIEPHMQRWSDIVVNHRDAHIAIDGVGFAGIGRLELLQLLQRRAADLGIVPQYGMRIDALSDLPDADLTIGADGLNSLLRRSNPQAFGEKITALDNRFVWYGANREFDALTQTFIDTPHGPMNAHHYSYAPGRATFIIEMGPLTFAQSGFADMAEPEYRAACEALFADHLQGAALIPNQSTWRQVPNLSCETWYHDNYVLVGDALHTAHFSIGSGTRLALEDVIALARALRDADWDVTAALPAYQSERQPVLNKIVTAARQSADWYEDFGTHMQLDPYPFALSYIRRAGRLSAERLARMAPAFTATLRAKGIDLEGTL
jgi:2-polyprenyl-6-methoxyphenol hydroxylase-like FAD-dependent oxidoreductase